MNAFTFICYFDFKVFQLRRSETACRIDTAWTTLVFTRGLKRFIQRKRATSSYKMKNNTSYPTQQ